MQRILLLCYLLLPGVIFAQLRTPGEFLPHELGETFTPHHLLVDYFEYVAENSAQVQLIEYGRTNEQRPLLLAFASTAENLNQLEAIRTNHLRRVGILEGSPDPSLDRAIVWLSFSVHGNEAAGSEASMGVLYDLANTNDPRTQQWLENTIIILDPSVNPDGYSRYTHWYRGVANQIPNAAPFVQEHREPWPGGRVNHYLFDLNRDWAWQTQVESRQRIVQYQQWFPHIHADLHEQYYTNPYYFAPAARPYHQYITGWQADFQKEIGSNHAKYFDREGWLYFTKERFDLFYPSYGDTYPTFTGAIGMTYEQGGHSRGGRAIELPTGDTLTLNDRVAHHRTTALSTVEIASLNLERLQQNFTEYFQNAQDNPSGPFKSYVIKADVAPDRVRALMLLLDRNGIQYGRLGNSRSLSAFDYTTGRTTTANLTSDDLVISAYQPLSVLTQVLLDPRSELEDSLTYDITAWSLPYAYGLQAYATGERIDPAPMPEEMSQDAPAFDESAYAYAIRWHSVADARLLAQLLAAGVQVRTTTRTLESGGYSFDPGTIVITRADNRKVEGFSGTVRRLAEVNGQEVYSLQTGLSDSGPDIGSDGLELISAPNVAVVAGESVSPNSFGQVWYYMEQDLGYPIHVLYDSDLPGDLSNVDVLILPEGNYGLSEANMEAMSRWVQGGGKLIPIGSALNAFTKYSTFGLKRKNGNGDSENADTTDQLEDYGGQERRYISNTTAGAIYEVTMDESHPLSYGIGPKYFSLKTGSRSFQFLDRGWNAGTIGADPLISGFVGEKAQERFRNSLTFGIEEKGRGQVIYLVDNPLYRGFWESGKFLFSNALFMVR